jgi:hypothetical protein
MLCLKKDTKKLAKNCVSAQTAESFGKKLTITLVFEVKIKCEKILLP